jgi:hypothetical protein
MKAPCLSGCVKKHSDFHKHILLLDIPRACTIPYLKINLAIQATGFPIQYC